MKRIKKYLCLLTALCMFTAVLAGCGGSSSDTASATYENAASADYAYEDYAYDNYAYADEDYMASSVAAVDES